MNDTSETETQYVEALRRYKHLRRLSRAATQIHENNYANQNEALLSAVLSRST
jgi:hypothetical protein